MVTQGGGYAPDQTLTDRVALVTGGGRRLGRTIALALGGEGASVAVHYNASDRGAEAVCELLTSGGVDARPFRSDLSDPGGLDDLVHRVWRWGGRLDVLVNNASVFPPGRLADMQFADLTSNMAVNAWAPLALTRSLWARASAAAMEASVVNLLDSRLVGGDPLHAAYFLSKAALSEITRMAAREFGPVLRVNGVAPGPILAPEGKDAAYLRQQRERLPLRRWGGPEQVAHAVVFLSAAAHVTGQTLFVDGGQHLHPPGPP